MTVEDGLYASEREHMVESQIVRRGVRDVRVLEAMRDVPRHVFVAPEYRYLAYADGPLPIGNGQTISQPYIVALMSELLELRGDEMVLEVGTGSGYQAAVLARLARQVHTIERYANLARYAAGILQELGLDNVHVHTGDGTKGLPDFAPYTGIIVTAAAPNIPRPLLDQLEDGGRLVIPVGSRGGQVLERWTRHGERFDYESIIPVAFVPLVGEQGWKD
ncbi:MAG: protein-L-isoaspartate O-methyltransferase [Chloroflexi bacterium RBG_16_57_11]|nr:MAG: protein-L-isoaspartate O-methyltransferase [Chloroflexi bacterium RBG_16_57_11]